MPLFNRMSRQNHKSWQLCTAIMLFTDSKNRLLDTMKIHLGQQNQGRIYYTNVSIYVPDKITVKMVYP